MFSKIIKNKTNIPKIIYGIDSIFNTPNQI